MATFQEIFSNRPLVDPPIIHYPHNFQGVESGREGPDQWLYFLEVDDDTQTMTLPFCYVRLDQYNWSPQDLYLAVIQKGIIRPDGYVFSRLIAFWPPDRRIDTREAFVGLYPADIAREVAPALYRNTVDIVQSITGQNTGWPTI